MATHDHPPPTSASRSRARQRWFRPDPYDGFGSDVERRKALNYRMTCRTITTITLAFAVAMSGGLENVTPTLRWAKVLVVGR